MHPEKWALLPRSSKRSCSSSMGRGPQHLCVAAWCYLSLSCFALPKRAMLGCTGLGWCGLWGRRLHSRMPNPCPPAVHPLHCKGLTGTPEKVLIGYLGVRVNRGAHILLKLVCYIYSKSCKFQWLEDSWKEMWPLCPWQIIISFPEVISTDNRSNEFSDILYWDYFCASF